MSRGSKHVPRSFRHPPLVPSVLNELKRQTRRARAQRLALDEISLLRKHAAAGALGPRPAALVHAWREGRLVSAATCRSCPLELHHVPGHAV